MTNDTERLNHYGSQREPELSDIRKRAVELARYACNGDEGRELGDPVFEEVTEGRARAKGYSACGDACHYVLSRLGLTDETIVNRNDDGGIKPWAMGANLSRLVYRTGKAFVWASMGKRPKPGDILYIAMPEHVSVLGELDEDAGSIATYDYGLVAPKTRKPAGKRCVSRFSIDNGKMRIGRRTLRGWVDIECLFLLKGPSDER